MRRSTRFSKNTPQSNYSWHLYYRARYNKDPANTDACILAMYYLFNHLLEEDTVT